MSLADKGFKWSKCFLIEQTVSRSTRVPQISKPGQVRYQQAEVEQKCRSTLRMRFNFADFLFRARKNDM